MTASSFVPPNELLVLGSDGSCHRTPAEGLWITSSSRQVSAGSLYDHLIRRPGAVVSCGTMIASNPSMTSRLMLLVEVETEDGGRTRRIWNRIDETDLGRVGFKSYSFRNTLRLEATKERIAGNKPVRIYCNGTTIWDATATVEFAFLRSDTFVTGFPAPIDKVQEIVDILRVPTEYLTVTVTGEKNQVDITGNLRPDVLPTLVL